MTPEKNNSVKKEVNKNKPTIANTLLKVGVSASMLLGASDCVVPPETTIETPQAGKTAPLPGDFTKTAESATDVNYEFTPTVANPATQELTLVSETEVATEMPTITLTPEPTPTATEALERYSLDLEKFYTMPPSYEDVVANPEKYQEAPDFFGDTEAAMKWWNETLIPALGDQRELTPNVFADFFALREPIFTFFSNNVSAEPLLADYPAFYFKHDNEIYLVPVFTIAEDDSKRHAGTFAVILYDSTYDGFINNEGLEEVENLYEGRKIRAVSGIRQPGRYILPDDVKKFVASEYNWAGLEKYAQTGVGYLIGVGVIGTISD